MKLNSFFFFVSLFSNLVSYSTASSFEFFYELIKSGMYKELGDMLKPININQVVSRNGNTLLHYAAGEMNKSGCINILLKHGAAINAKNHKGETPLYYAITACNHSAVLRLIQADADLFVNNNEGKTPKEYAQAMLNMYQGATMKTEKIKPKVEALQKIVADIALYEELRMAVGFPE